MNINSNDNDKIDDIIQSVSLRSIHCIYVRQIKDQLRRSIQLFFMYS